jgi:uncharacterized protein YidB (DUF937 family)
MSMLETILGAVTDATATNETESDNNIMSSLIGLISDQQSGSLAGLIEKFSANGLGDQVASWISTGENSPISGEQIQMVLGSSFVRDLALKMGVDTDNMASSLAVLIPQIVDKLTPDGEVPSSNNNHELLQQIAITGLTGLSSLLFSNNPA